MPRFRGPVARRLLPLGLAAALAISSVAVALAESGPGQPFYRLRLDVETLTLPPDGTPARLEADIARADDRLAELVSAGRAGDVAAADDSAGAYQDALDSVLAARGAAGASDLEGVLADHDALLQRALGDAAPAARGALSRAAAAVRDAEEHVNPAAGPGGAGDTHGVESAGSAVLGVREQSDDATSDTDDPTEGAGGGAAAGHPGDVEGPGPDEPKDTHGGPQKPPKPAPPPKPVPPPKAGDAGSAQGKASEGPATNGGG